MPIRYGSPDDDELEGYQVSASRYWSSVYGGTGASRVADPEMGDVAGGKKPDWKVTDVIPTFTLAVEEFLKMEDMPQPPFYSLFILDSGDPVALARVTPYSALGGGIETTGLTQGSYAADTFNAIDKACNSDKIANTESSYDLNLLHLPEVYETAVWLTLVDPSSTAVAGSLFLSVPPSGLLKPSDDLVALESFRRTVQALWSNWPSASTTKPLRTRRSAAMKGASLGARAEKQK